MDRLGPPKPIHPELKRLRGKIDEIDCQIIALIDQRAGIAKTIGKFKKTQKVGVLDNRREAKVLSMTQFVHKDHIQNGGINKIFKEIMRACRAVQSGG